MGRCDTGDKHSIHSQENDWPVQICLILGQLPETPKNSSLLSTMIQYNTLSGMTENMK